MGKKIKLIWDFFGEDSLKTAEHHALHLREFAKMKKMELFDANTEKIEDGQCSAYMVVDEKDMLTVRDTLRPKRGEWVEDK